MSAPDRDPLESFVDDLAGSLPRLPESAALLDEVRDHLLCEVEDAEAGGSSPGSARAAAVRRIGDAGVIAAGWRTELLRSSLRRTATAVLRLVVVAGVAWSVVLARDPAASPRGGAARPVVHLEELGSASAGLAVAAAAAVAVLLVGAARSGPPVPRCALDRWAVRATVLALGACAATGGLLADLLRTLARTFPGSVSELGVLAATACSLGGVAAAVPALDRARRVLRAPRTSAAPVRDTGGAVGGGIGGAVGSRARGVHR